MSKLRPRTQVHELAAAKRVTLVKYRAQLRAGKIRIDEGIGTGRLDDMHPSRNPPLACHIEMLRPHAVDYLLRRREPLPNPRRKPDTVSDFHETGAILAPQHAGNEV